MRKASMSLSVERGQLRGRGFSASLSFTEGSPKFLRSQRGIREGGAAEAPSVNSYVRSNADYSHFVVTGMNRRAHAHTGTGLKWLRE
ncbi:hypothetical protein CEXT_382781 [Caerostris extrusa]|uniref:Uncharacterized protein n=1 Tax=Caerostris extrusa TaxID=172846 RepID=A0AAV4VF31_CAEEX|nr:hypothetical protein CEXT_382781 [Caerostris extrusa]